MGGVWVSNLVCCSQLWTCISVCFAQGFLVSTLLILECVEVLAAQSCLTLGSDSWVWLFVHEVLQARILDWVAISSSRRSSWPRDWTWVSCIAGTFFTIWSTREAPVDPWGLISSFLGRGVREQGLLCAFMGNLAASLASTGQLQPVAIKNISLDTVMSSGEQNWRRSRTSV